MTPTVLEQAADLQRAGQPFVMVTVVWRRGPSSSQQGAKALILPDGTLRGWLGGACAQPRLVSEALTALGDGRPRLLLLGPLGELERGHREGVETVPIACASEGAMEVYVEPVLPALQIVAIGRTPAVDALLGMALVLGWRVDVVDVVDDTGALSADSRTAVVVATQGNDDERALEAALRTDAGYVGLVASRPRAGAVVDYLRARGVAESNLARVRAPAGLDLGRTSPEEIGVAVLAELVQLRAAGTFGGRGESAGPAVNRVIDPVCGMTVIPSPTQHQRQHAGRVWYFCGPGCGRLFEADPERYVASAGATDG